ncbi:hypothetical protein HC358_00830 [Wolbachia pipientis]|uniref:Ankyrin repeat domain-containing protein n=1 Tax=Wolbachia pipientis TaxID=955 RepID=A0A7G5C913_WOLPI|nr:ankyrin repeat domain-containing protein [Wolbachia pipientis]QMV45697.1 hypothetical protein HC358_00830 [Wolbachia pipientis]
MDLKKGLVLLDSVILYLKQGDRESAERQVENLARSNQWELKDVYDSSLCLAASYGEIEAAEFCRDRGADLDCEDLHRRTPLCIALLNGHLQMAESLRAWGARKDHPSLRYSSPSEREPYTFDYSKQDSIHGGFSNKMSLYWKEIFLYFKQDDGESAERRVESLARNHQWELKDIYGYLLCAAAQYGEIGVAEFYKDKGADLDYEDRYGRTPLCLALMCNHPQMVKYLRKCGVSRGTHKALQWGYIYHNESKDTILFFVEGIFSSIKQDVEQGDRKSAERTIENLTGARKWNHKELYGHLLCIAARHGKIGVAEFCKDKGADLDYEDYDGRTPLCLASQFNHLQMAEYLRKWGAREDHLSFGYSSLSSRESAIFDYPAANSIHAVLRNVISFYWEEIFLYFEQDNRESAGRRVESLARNHQWELKDVYNYLLHVAARNGKIGVAEFCKDKGADLDYEDRGGRTPLRLALKFNHLQMAESLREWGAREDHPSLRYSSPSSRESITFNYSGANSIHGGFSNKMSLYWEEIFLYFKQDDGESAERRVESLARRNQWKLKDVYSYLLHVAARNGKIGVAEFYKDKGADLDYEDRYGRTPLWLALRFNHVQMAESLRRWGASRGARAVLQWGYTYSGKEKNAVQLSMEVIFSSIKQDVEQGDGESAERRIEDLTQEKKWNHKALCGHLLCIAAHHGEIGVAELCKDKGADLDYEDYDGRTPLWIAIEHGQEKMAQALGEWGACKGTHEISSEVQSFSIKRHKKWIKKHVG